MGYLQNPEVGEASRAIVAALAAYEHVTNHQGRSLSALFYFAAFRYERAMAVNT